MRALLAIPLPAARASLEEVRDEPMRSPISFPFCVFEMGLASAEKVVVAPRRKNLKIVGSRSRSLLHNCPPPLTRTGYGSCFAATSLVTCILPLLSCSKCSDQGRTPRFSFVRPSHKLSRTSLKICLHRVCCASLSRGIKVVSSRP